MIITRGNYSCLKGYYRNQKKRIYSLTISEDPKRQINDQLAIKVQNQVKKRLKRLKYKAKGGWKEREVTKGSALPKSCCRKMFFPIFQG